MKKKIVSVFAEKNKPLLVNIPWALKQQGKFTANAILTLTYILKGYISRSVSPQLRNPLFWIPIFLGT